MESMGQMDQCMNGLVGGKWTNLPHLYFHSPLMTHGFQGAQFSPLVIPSIFHKNLG